MVGLPKGLKVSIFDEHGILCSKQPWHWLAGDVYGSEYHEILGNSSKCDRGWAMWHPVVKVASCLNKKAQLWCFSGYDSNNHLAAGFVSPDLGSLLVWVVFFVLYIIWFVGPHLKRLRCFQRGPSLKFVSSLTPSFVVVPVHMKHPAQPGAWSCWTAPSNTSKRPCFCGPKHHVTGSFHSNEAYQCISHLRVEGQDFSRCIWHRIEDFIRVCLGKFFGCTDLTSQNRCTWLAAECRWRNLSIWDPLQLGSWNNCTTSRTHWCPAWRWKWSCVFLEVYSGTLPFEQSMV